MKNLSKFCKIVGNFFSKNWVIFSAEWTYLLTERKVGDEDSAFSYVRIKYGDHETDTVTGTIIYPDDFSFSEVGVASMKFGTTRGVQAEIDKATWEALESAGCVFLPCARNRSFASGQQIIDEEGFGQYSYYWSSSAQNASSAINTGFNFPSRVVGTESGSIRYAGFAVRLAQDL